jgi:iron complex transport system substrate-binding protein
VASTAANAAATTGDTGSNVPQRIVSLSATHTEMLYAIGAGDQVVATDLTSDYPPQAAETAKVDAFNFNVEEVAALDPDLVILAFDFNDEVAALEAAGVESLLLPPPPTLVAAYEQFLAVGLATGHLEEANQVSGDLKRDIGGVLANIPHREPPPVIFHEVDATLFSANSDTFLGDIYREFGFVNLADEVPDEFGSGFVQVSEEFILESDPDIIFLADADFGEDVASVSARPGWENVAAVQERRVVELDGSIAGRWGPRTLDLVRQIAAAVEELA